MDVQHKIPKLLEINLELKDPKYYINDNITLEKLVFSVNSDAKIVGSNELLFFIHLRISYKKDENDNPYYLLHTDYISRVEMVGVDWNNLESIDLDQMALSNVLGMSILMMRGAISSRIRNNSLNQFPLPIINPFELLSKHLKKGERDKTFVVTREFKIGPNPLSS